MLIDVTHISEFGYDRPITESVMELRLQPRVDLTQRVQSFDLSVEPTGHLATTVDAFGNVVHHYNFRPPHQLIRIVAHSVVETGLAGDPAPPDRWRFQYLRLDGPVEDIPDVLEVAERLRPHDEDDPPQIEGAVSDLTGYIHDRFEYRGGVTTWQSTVADLVASGSGVCQDFTHYWIAACRAMGIPARYVSGYVHHPRESGDLPVTEASHAWGEAWVPDKGWCGFDPTNPVSATPYHVKVGVGRDYRDVPPTKGVFLGPATERIVAEVATRLLDPTAAPGAPRSTQWQQQSG